MGNKTIEELLAELPQESVLLGCNKEGKAVGYSLGATARPMLVVGGSNYPSELLHNMLLAAAMRYSADDLYALILTNNPEGWAWHIDLPQVLGCYLPQAPATLSELESLETHVHAQANDELDEEGYADRVLLLIDNLASCAHPTKVQLSLTYLLQYGLLGGTYIIASVPDNQLKEIESTLQGFGTIAVSSEVKRTPYLVRLLGLEDAIEDIPDWGDYLLRIGNKGWAPLYLSGF